jgi:hypothetical protein
MNKADCRIGMEVVFGKGNGEKTKGKVVKLNRTTAGVRTEEDRGRHTAGAVWRVSYNLLSPSEENNVLETPITSETIVYNIYQDQMEQHILEAIACCYNKLSPENISCDGELPPNVVEVRRRELNRKLEGLFQALGRRVGEYSIFNWLEQKKSKI